MGNRNYSSDSRSTLHDGCVFVVKYRVARAIPIPINLSGLFLNPARSSWTYSCLDFVEQHFRITQGIVPF